MRPPCLIYLSTRNEARPRERSGRGRFLRKKDSSYRGVYKVPLFNLCVCVCLCVCQCVYMCNIRRFTDCESCTRPISTNPRSMESCEYGLARGTCFVASRLEVVAVAGLLWISWCVLGAARFRVFFSSFYFLRTSNAHGLLL